MLRHALLIIGLLTFASRVECATTARREVVVVRSGSLQLRAVLWRPAGKGVFPAVMFNHGGGGALASPEGRAAADVFRRQPDILGPVFAQHGYAFLYLYRRGVGLSAGQGTWSGDLLDREREQRGVEAMNRLQIELLDGREAADVQAALAFLRSRRDIDANRIAMAGHSFGGSLTMFVAEREPGLRAVVNLAGAAASWPRSPELRKRLLAALPRIAVPVMFIHPANDYSTEPGRILSAEMQRLGKPHVLKIYPPQGKTAYDGHNLIALDPSIWEKDVFEFLDQRLRP